MPVNKIIEQHPQTISTLVNIEQMRYILDGLYSVKDIPGDVVELACNIGTTALYIRRLLNMLEYEGAQLPGVKVACDYFLKDKPEKVSDVFYGMAKIIKE